MSENSRKKFVKQTGKTGKTGKTFCPLHVKSFNVNHLVKIDMSTSKYIVEIRNSKTGEVELRDKRDLKPEFVNRIKASYLLGRDVKTVASLLTEYKVNNRFYYKRCDVENLRDFQIHYKIENR